MSLHLSILRRESNTERPKGMHKRARTSSTELLDAFDEDPIIVEKQEGPPLGNVLIINCNDFTRNEDHPPMETVPNKPSPVFSSTEWTALFNDETSSVQSLIEQSEGFESGFETFDDFLNYSSSSSREEEQEVKISTKSKLKLKLKKVKTNLKTCLDVKKRLKRINKNSGTILRAIGNVTSFLFRGVLSLTVNILIVITIIISLAML